MGKCLSCSAGPTQHIYVEGRGAMPMPSVGMKERAGTELEGTGAAGKAYEWIGGESYEVGR